MSSLAAIPTLDLSDYTSCDTSLRDRAIATLGEALVELGFVIVEGHAVEARLFHDAYTLWQRFFALDEAVKRQYAAGGNLGFTPFGVEHAKGNPAPDQKEFWHVGQEVPADHALYRLYPENPWPREVPELRRPTIALYRELERVAELLLMALAEHFGLPDQTFAAMIRQGASVLRILHYPPVTAAAAGAPRAAPHEDINFITLLCAATDSGLELQRRDGTWLAVEALPGQIVVDAGDMLSRLTNGVVPAATHRVVAPAGGAGRERFSMPFFVHPRAACDLAVLDRFVSAGRPRRFPPTTAGELLDERLREIGIAPAAAAARPDAADR
jgi:isopenicillin N synthase-like dioxygenase